MALLIALAVELAQQQLLPQPHSLTLAWGRGAGTQVLLRHHRLRHPQTKFVFTLINKNPRAFSLKMKRIKRMTLKTQVYFGTYLMSGVRDTEKKSK